MKRRCVSCKVEIEVANLKTKYCVLCAEMEKRRQIREWQIKKKEFDLFCLDCNESLPINAKADKKYCTDCLRKRVIKSHCRWAWSRRRKAKLEKFYKNLRINFIQSPYLKTLKETEIVIKI